MIIFLTQIHWTQVFEVIPDVSNAIQQTCSVIDGSLYDLALFILVVLLPQLWVLKLFQSVLTLLCDLVLAVSKKDRKMEECLRLCSSLGFANECAMIPKGLWTIGWESKTVVEVQLIWCPWVQACSAIALCSTSLYFNICFMLILFSSFCLFHPCEQGVRQHGVKLLMCNISDRKPIISSLRDLHVVTCKSLKEETGVIDFAILYGCRILFIAVNWPSTYRIHSHQFCFRLVESVSVLDGFLTHCLLKPGA